MAGATYICGEDTRPGPRNSDCPNALHDWPLPSGYIEAQDEARWRLRHQWSNKRCPECKLYGWMPGELHEGLVRVSLVRRSPDSGREADQ